MLRYPYKMSPRRQCDTAEFWSDSNKAKAYLNWCAKRDLQEMMHDALNWRPRNPNGYVVSYG